MGRERELAEVRRTLRRHPSVVLVEGEAGIGKSRLVRESLAGLPGRVVIGACPPVRRPFTLGPVVDAVRQACGAAGGVGGLRLSPLSGALRPLFPEWAAQLPPAPEPLDDAAAARHRLCCALAELLAGLAVTTLVLEDAHWADESTLEFLLLILSRPRTLSLVVTYRPEEVHPGSLVRRLPTRLAGLSAGVRVTLAPLDRDGTAELASSMLGGEPVSEALAAFLHERTGGLPLAVEESVRLLSERADLTRRDREGTQQWIKRSLTDLQVPPTVRDSVLERAERLSLAAQRVLQAASVFSEPVDEATLSAVSGLPASLARAGLAEAVRSGLLDEQQVGFRHVLAARAVYESLTAAERRRLHQLAGEVLRAGRQAPLHQLARHFREAGDVANWCRHAEEAADVAIGAGDDRTAVALLHDVLASADRTRFDAPRLARKLALLASSRRNVFDHLVRQVASTLRGVLDEPGLDARRRAEIAAPFGRLLIQLGQHDAGYAELRRAIPDLDHDPVEAARTMNYLAWPFASPVPAAEHLAWLDRAAKVAAGVASPEERLTLTVDRLSALLQLGEEAGWVVAAELPGDAPTFEERLQITRGQLNTGWAAMRWGRYQEAGRLMADALRSADADGNLRQRWYVLVAQAHLDWFTGNWDGLAERVAGFAEADEASPANRLEAILIAGLVEAATGARRSAEQRFNHVLVEGRKRGGLDIMVEPAAALARLRLADGAPEEALRLAAEAMQTVAGKEIWIWGADIARVYVEALAATDRVAEGAELVAAYGRWLRGRDVPAGAAALAECRALLAASRGEHARAAVLAGRAATLWERLPRPYDAVLARERQAHYLLAAGRHETGIPLLSEVFAALAELGARRDADRLVHVLRDHGLTVRRPQRGGRRGYGEQLSPRELDVVGLVAKGQTNREIAEALVLSPKTVARHLDSAMRKLGVSSRTALAVTAVEAGLVPGRLDGDDNLQPA